MRHRILSFIFRALGIVICFLCWNHAQFWLIIGTYVFTYLLLISVGSYFIKLNFFITSQNSYVGDGILLTFDDGPNPETTPRVLDILDEHGIKAIFFVIGKKAASHPELLVDIMNRGHVLGNHSNSHHDLLPFFWKRKFIRDFDKCQQLIRKITGFKTPLLRPPFGVTCPNYYSMLRKRDWLSVGWNIRTYDTNIKSTEQLQQAVLNGIKKGQGNIVLMHDTISETVEALPSIIHQLNANGIKIDSPWEIPSLKLQKHV